MRSVLCLLALLLGLAFSRASFAYSYCVYDGGYLDNPEQCFPTLAQARQYLYSNAGKGAKMNVDVDSTLFEPAGVYLSNDASGLVKTYLFRYPTMAPKYDFGQVVSIFVSFPLGEVFCTDNQYPIYQKGCADDASALALAQQRAQSYWQSSGYERPLGPWRLIDTVPENTYRPSTFFGPGDTENVIRKETQELIYEADDPWGSADGFIGLQTYHFWKCPWTHSYVISSTWGQFCRSGPSPYRSIGGQITVKNEPIRLCASCSVNNPIHPQTGLKTQQEPDFEWDGLNFSHLYHSSSEAPASAAFGRQWVHSLDIELRKRGDADEYIGRIGTQIEVYKRDTASTYYYSTSAPGARLRAETMSAELSLPNGRTITFGPRDIYSRYPTVDKITDRTSGKSYLFSYCPDTAEDPTCSVGQIRGITSSSGRHLDFLYADFAGTSGSVIGNRLFLVSADDHTLVTYGYDGFGRLKTASYPNSLGDVTRTYFYNQAGRVCVSGTGSTLSPCYVTENDALLTSIQDEKGVEFGIYKYDNLGRAVSSEHQGGANKVTVSYPSDNSAIVTDSNGTATTYNSIPSRFFQMSSMSRSGKTITISRDANGYPDLVTDRAGIVSDADFDAVGRLTRLVLAKGKPEQQIKSFQWDGAANRPSLSTVDGQSVSTTFNSRAQGVISMFSDLASSPVRTRTSTRSYCELQDISAGRCAFLGQLLQIDGPRQDVADIETFSYYTSDDLGCASQSSCAYRAGDLWKVVEPNGSTLEYLEYDYAGRPVSLKDANGVRIDFSYSPRGLLIARIVRGSDPNSEADDAITRLTYDKAGLMTRIDFPDATFVILGYDAAHRFSSATDAYGNTYTLTLTADGMSRKEETKTVNGVLKQTLARTFNTLGQLQAITDAYQNSETRAYDVAGHTDTIVDAFGRTMDVSVDPLARLSGVLENSNKKHVDEANTSLQYDGRSNLTLVADPRQMTTNYGFDGFDELRSISSPDKGVRQFSYDQAGALSTTTDARGITLASQRDSMSRLISVTPPTAGQRETFTYDVVPSTCPAAASYGIGRLGQMQDESGTTTYCYDPRGNLMQTTQTATLGSTLTLGTSWNSAGRLNSMTYPSGAVVSYGRDANGQIARIDVVPAPGEPQATLVQNVQYLPFGPLQKLDFGNGRSLSRSFDLNYRIDAETDSATNGVSIDYTLDPIGNPTSISERTSAGMTNTRSLQYDALNRLLSRKSGSTVVESFKYDAVGNRTSKTVGASSVALSYVPATNRLSAVGSVTRNYDNSGSTTQIGSGVGAQGFVYDDFGQLRDYKVGGVTKASYRYNGAGRRVVRLDTTNPSNSRQFVYDLRGHLIGEYTSTGVQVQEYVWLDDLLVGVISDQPMAKMQYVETDYLGTPRAVVHPGSNAIIWRWNVNESGFGDHAPITDPDADGTVFALAARFPGQWQDPVSGYVYNASRDFDPSTGRYLQSDSIGLAGGSSTYAYARNRPGALIDPNGMDGEAPLGLTLHADRNYHVVGNIVEGDSYEMYPNFGATGNDPPVLSQPSNRAAAITKMLYKVVTTCSEPSEPGEESKLVSAAMTISFETLVRPAKVLVPKTEHDERQHITEYSDWMELYGTPVFQATVNEMRDECWGTDREDCEKSSNEKLYNQLVVALTATAGQINAKTVEKHDCDTCDHMNEVSTGVNFTY